MKRNTGVIWGTVAAVVVIIIIAMNWGNITGGSDTASSSAANAYTSGVGSNINNGNGTSSTTDGTNGANDFVPQSS